MDLTTVAYVNKDDEIAPDNARHRKEYGNGQIIANISNNVEHENAE